MKLCIGIAVGVLLGIALMVLVPRGTPHIVLADTPSGNGDVNGSGVIDIADAIYLLGYLFASGPEPEVIRCDDCCLPCEPCGLPATGQTTCFATDGTVIDCGSVDWPGQDALYQKECPSAGRFVDNGDETVTDNCTGLVWQKHSVSGDYTWQNALKYCENLSLAGHGDWRLPNVRELESIVDYGRRSPAMDPVFEVKAGYYWSSTTNYSGVTRAWMVGFVDGHVSGENKGEYRYVRAVRG